MPKIKTNDIKTYYEIHGKGYPLVFIHGGWVSHKMWKPQIEYFSKEYQVIIYDVRGHGNTGSSLKKKYSMEMFADDLKILLDKLNIEKPIICGLSMGGMIAQPYAVKYPDNLKALILSDTAISTEFTLSDKIIKYLLAPKWMFLLVVRLLGVKRYADFAFWLARKSRGKKWVGQDEGIIKYEKEEMMKFKVKEFNKIFAGIYDFKLQELSKIKVPALLINGEFESKSVFKHSEKMNELISNSSMVVIPNAGHTSNLENPEEFNKAIEKFLEEIGK